MIVMKVLLGNPTKLAIVLVVVLLSIMMAASMASAEGKKNKGWNAVSVDVYKRKKHNIKTNNTCYLKVMKNQKGRKLVVRKK